MDVQPVYREIFIEGRCFVELINVLDVYIIKHVLGLGAFSRVLLGMDRRDKKYYALKFRPIRDDDNRQVIREIEIHQEISSLGISPCYYNCMVASSLSLFPYDTILTDQYYFVPCFYFVIVMEYIEGYTLETYVKMGVPSSPETAIDIMSQVLTTLDKLHKQGITHRDIKTDNIIYNERTKKATLIDYGFSIHSREPICTSISGSPCYLSPEGWMDKFRYDPSLFPRADIWALGIVFYRLLTLCFPFWGKNLPELGWAIIHEGYPPISSRPSRAIGYITLMLDKDPMKRPTAGQLLDWMNEKAL